MQKGLQFYSHNGTVHCELYNTVVFTCDTREGKNGKLTRSIQFSHGGWITMSTRRAINKGLEAAGIDGKCFIKRGEMYVNLGGKVYAIDATPGAGRFMYNKSL